jgi:hypothetical protein
VIFSAFAEDPGCQVQQKFYGLRFSGILIVARKTLVVLDNRDILRKRKISHFVQLTFLYKTRCKQFLSFLFLESEETHKTTKFVTESRVTWTGRLITKQHNFRRNKCKT